MNKAILHTYLADPVNLQRSDIQELKQLLDQYPYVQAIRSLYLKSLYSNESTSYNQELKKTAAYTLDRDILFSFIISDDFTTYTPLENKIQEDEIEDTSSLGKTKDKNPEQTISTLLQTISKVAYSITQEDNSQPLKIEENKIKVEDSFEDSTPEVLAVIPEDEAVLSAVEILENKLEIGQPLAFDEGEKYSFQEWLKLSKQQPIKRELGTEKEGLPQDKEEKREIITEEEKKFQESLEKKQALIDKFIETNPKILPTKKGIPSPINIELSLQENTSLMTETLAKIYLEQKKYQKAIQAYEILILKYPEKSGFFANQILDIKALQQHNSL